MTAATKQRMNKKDLTNVIYGELDNCSLSKIKSKVFASDLAGTILSSIKRELGNGGEVFFQDFGTFKVRMRAPRTARNPQTGDMMDIPAKKVVVFKPHDELKRLVADS